MVYTEYFRQGLMFALGQEKEMRLQPFARNNKLSVLERTVQLQERSRTVLQPDRAIRSNSTPRIKLV
jgi:hypothetical protein